MSEDDFTAILDGTFVDGPAIKKAKAASDEFFPVPKPVAGHMENDNWQNSGSVRISYPQKAAQDPMPKPQIRKQQMKITEKKEEQPVPAPQKLFNVITLFEI